MALFSWRKMTALVACTAAVVALGACGSTTNNSSQGDYKTQPLNGVPATYTGKLPLPEHGKAYNNPHPRSDIKDGGSVTLATVEVGPDLNYLSANGNTTYVAGFWAMTRPHLWTTQVDGSEVPNKDFLESVKLVSKDPETIQYNLNPKAKYNNGDPITWESLKATWEVMNGKNKAYSPSATDGYSSIGSVERGSSDFQAIVKFDQPFYPYEGLFDYVIPPAAANPDTFNKGWIKNIHTEWGGGPFVVDSMSDSQISFKPNPKWWGLKPKLDKVTFKVMSSEASLNAFKNGEIDATGFGTKNRLESIRGMKNVRLVRNYDPNVGVYMINAKSITDINLRKAVFEAINRKEVAKIDYQGLDWNVDGAGSLGVYSFQKGYENNLPKDLQTYTKGQASKTLESAGYKKGADGYFAKDGKVAQLNYVVIGESPVAKAEAQAIQAMEKSEGIKLNVEFKPASEFSKTLTGGAWDMFALGWSASNAYGYAQSGCQMYCTDSGDNFSKTGSKQIDEMLKQIPRTPDNATSIKLFNKAEKEIFKQYGNLPSFEGPAMTAYKDGLANVGPSLFASTNWLNVGWLKSAKK